MKTSRGSMAHKVMTLLKMALREFRAGGCVKFEAVTFWFRLSVAAEVTFWDLSRRFVKYFRGGRQNGWHLSPGFTRADPGPTSPVLYPQSHQSGCHEKIPGEQCSQPQDEKDEPYSPVPGGGRDRLVIH